MKTLRMILTSYDLAADGESYSRPDDAPMTVRLQGTHFETSSAAPSGRGGLFALHVPPRREDRHCEPVDVALGQRPRNQRQPQHPRAMPFGAACKTNVVRLQARDRRAREGLAPLRRAVAEAHDDLIQVHGVEHAHA